MKKKAERIGNFIVILLIVLFTLLIFNIISVIVSEILTTDKGWWPVALIFISLHTLAYSILYALLTYKYNFSYRYHIIYSSAFGLYFIFFIVLFFKVEFIEVISQTLGLYELPIHYTIFLFARVFINRYLKKYDKREIKILQNVKIIAKSFGIAVFISTFLLLVVIYVGNIFWILSTYECSAFKFKEYEFKGVHFEIIEERCDIKDNNLWIYFTLKQTNTGDNTSQLLWIEINGSTYNNLGYDTFTTRNFFNVIKDLDNFNSIEPNDYHILKYHTYLMNTTSVNNLTIVIPRRYK